MSTASPTPTAIVCFLHIPAPSLACLMTTMGAATRPGARPPATAVRRRPLYTAATRAPPAPPPVSRHAPPSLKLRIHQIIHLVTQDGLHPREPHDLVPPVQFHHLIRRQQRPRHMLEGHRAPPHQSRLPLFYRMQHG